MSQGSPARVAHEPVPFPGIHRSTARRCSGSDDLSENEDEWMPTGPSDSREITWTFGRHDGGTGTTNVPVAERTDCQTLEAAGNSGRSEV